MTQPIARLYPVGIRNFTKIREKHYVYVDKTAYIYCMTHSDAENVFLSRPRRFGSTCGQKRFTSLRPRRVSNNIG